MPFCDFFFIARSRLVSRFTILNLLFKASSAFLSCHTLVAFYSQFIFLHFGLLFVVRFCISFYFFIPVNFSYVVCCRSVCIPLCINCCRLILPLLPTFSVDGTPFFFALSLSLTPIHFLCLRGVGSIHEVIIRNCTCTFVFHPPLKNTYHCLFVYADCD